MKKGFFISVDLIISIALVIFLLGVLGYFLHSSISGFSNYKSKILMQADMEIALNRVALSENSCDLISEDGRALKKLSFCLDVSNLPDFSDLQNNVSLVCDDCKDSFPSNAKEYMGKELDIFISDGKVEKSRYVGCFNNDCDLKGKVKIYVWK